MPSFWNNILVVTVEELVPEYFGTLKTLQSAIRRAEKRGYGIRKAQSGGGLGRVLLIDFDSLPKRIQDGLGDPRKHQHLLERYYETDLAAYDFFESFIVARTKEGLDDKQIEEYTTNASVLRAIEKLKSDRERERLSKGHNLQGLYQSLLNDASSFKAALKAKWSVEHTLPESLRRFKETYQDFVKNYDYNVLLDGRMGNVNASRVSPSMIKLLNSMFVSQTWKPNYTDVARQYEGFLNGYVEVINNETGEVYDPKEFKKVDEKTIYNYLAMWENRLFNELRRSGDRQKYMEKFDPYESMKPPKFAGSIVSVDDRQPPFTYGDNKRVWFYIAQDLGSQAITTWVWADDKKKMIVEFYRQMVRNYTEWGLCLPNELECESNLNASFRDTLLKEGNMFNKVRIEANKARSKRIERTNKSFRYELEKQMDGFLGRPHARLEANQPRPGKAVEIPYETIVENTLRNIESWNNSECPGHEGKSRWEVFMEKQHPDLTPINYRRILPYIGFKTKTSVHRGILKFRGSEYLIGNEGKLCFGEELIEKMRKIEGEEVTICWLDGNNGSPLKALIYHDDKYVCEAVLKPISQRAQIEMTPEDRMAREMMNKYIATIQGFRRQKGDEFEKVTVLDYRTTVLNDKFKMPGIRRMSVLKNEAPTEVLPEAEDEQMAYEYADSYETEYKPSLNQRF